MVRANYPTCQPLTRPPDLRAFLDEATMLRDYGAHHSRFLESVTTASGPATPDPHGAPID